MARKINTEKVNAKILKLTEKIDSYEAELVELKKERDELLEAIKEAEIAELVDAIKVSGLTIEQAKEKLFN